MAARKQRRRRRHGTQSYVSASCKLSYLLFHTHNKQASYKLDFFILVSLVLPWRDNKKDENHASRVPHTHLAEML